MPNMKSLKCSSTAFFLLITISYCLKATTIIPFPNLGEMALASDAVVIGEVVSVAEKVFGYETRIEYELEVIESVSGELAEGAIFNVVRYSAFGDDWIRVVPEDINLDEGSKYLLFLSRNGDYWQPLLISYGIFKQVNYNEVDYLVPLLEGTYIHVISRPDGKEVEPLMVYKKRALTEMLHKVANGSGSWNQSEIIVNPDIQQILSQTLRAAPAHCTFLQSGGVGFRWQNFPGTALPVHYPSAGDSDCSPATSANTYVQNAITDMSSSYQGINLTDGGTYSGFSPDCTDGTAVGSDFQNWVNTNLGGSRHIVVQYNDPCSEITNLTSCAGTLAIGGLYGFGPSYTYDGQQWYIGAYGYVIVNNDVCTCLSATNYKIVMTHELTHTLGLDHIDPSNGVANMNPSCCNSIQSLDIQCVDYLYPVALPIELLTFRAEKQGEGVVLTWQTASELNNDRFVIERAGLDLNFELIGQINGAGTTLEEQQYTFTDRHPLSGQNYYRLRQIDFDGNSSFSPYAFVEFASEYDEVSFYPNPMSESGLTIELSAREAGRLEVQIFNLAGLMLANYSYEIDEGYNKLNINARDLHPGMYQLILTVDGSRQISKLVVH